MAARTETEGACQHRRNVFHPFAPVRALILAGAAVTPTHVGLSLTTVVLCLANFA